MSIYCKYYIGYQHNLDRPLPGASLHAQVRVPGRLVPIVAPVFSKGPKESFGESFAQTDFTDIIITFSKLNFPPSENNFLCCLKDILVNSSERNKMYSFPIADFKLAAHKNIADKWYKN